MPQTFGAPLGSRRIGAGGRCVPPFDVGELAREVAEGGAVAVGRDVALSLLGERGHVSHGVGEIERRAVDLGYAQALQWRDFTLEDGSASACEQRDMGDALLCLLFDYLSEEGHVPAVVGADGDGGGVLLRCGLGDLVGRLVEADVDGLGVLVAEDAGDSGGGDIVAVTDRRGYNETGRASHRRQYNGRMLRA